VAFLARRQGPPAVFQRFSSVVFVLFSSGFSSSGFFFFYFFFFVVVVAVVVSTSTATAKRCAEIVSRQSDVINKK